MKQKKQAKAELKFEVIYAEPMTEEQVDALTELFAKAIVQKMLSRKGNDQNSKTKENEITLSA